MVDSELDDVWSLLDSAAGDQPNEPDDSIDLSIKIVPELINNILHPRRLDYNSALSYQVFQNRVRRNQPIIITGLVSNWPALETWKDHSYFAELLGSEQILVLQAKDNVHFLKNELTIHHQMPGNEFVNTIFHAQDSNTNPETRWYARSEFHVRFFPDVQLPYKFLLPDDDPNQKNTTAFRLPLKQKNCTVWMSVKGNITPLHFDLCHGLLCQVSGRKKVTLFHKDDFRLMYQNPATHVNKTVSELIDYCGLRDGNEALREQYSKILEATPYVCELGPGEAMYIPPFFWHHVESLSSCISVLIPFDMTGDEPPHPCCFFDK